MAGLVEASRVWFGERGRQRFSWRVAEGARPADLVDRLLDLGLQPYEDDPVVAAMVLEREPLGTPGVEIRRVATFDDLVALEETAMESFGFSEEHREATRRGRSERFERIQGNTRGDEFVALVDGHVVGSAGVSYSAAGVYLGGGNVLPAARGRGVYRALVRARWDVAVERGTPALVTQAGQMSRPILARLGFRTICEIQALVDTSAA